MVGIRVALQLYDAPDLNVFYCRGEVARDLHLGAGDGHRLGKLVVADLLHGQVDKFIEPLS